MGERNVDKWEDRDLGVTDSELESLYSFLLLCNDSDGQHDRQLDRLRIAIERKPGTRWKHARRWAVRETRYWTANLAAHYLLHHRFEIRQTLYERTFRTVVITPMGKEYTGSGPTLLESVLAASDKVTAALERGEERRP